MELLPLRAPPAPWKAGRASHCKVRNASVASLIKFNSHGRGRQSWFVVSALPETAASVVFTAMAVGAAASLLARTTKASDTAKSTLKTCEDCGGPDWLQRTWPLVTPQDFQRSGVIAQGACLLGLVLLVEGQGELAEKDRLKDVTVLHNLLQVAHHQCLSLCQHKALDRSSHCHPTIAICLSCNQQTVITT
ncbi:hypothetical protein OPV22_007939 [Ensete ventricosum]|uniref:Uncharacterized protein n=1 Tax=Ensete ventricosum TaxID=4639 RepID=A0AAV8RFU7_ENSVE|nr:hypothetical protein OPV22_007939 [Ensete ventricosum]